MFTRIIYDNIFAYLEYNEVLWNRTKYLRNRSPILFPWRGDAPISPISNSSRYTAHARLSNGSGTCKPALNLSPFSGPLKASFVGRDLVLTLHVVSFRMIRTWREDY